MANNINFGKIYDSTWWGVGVTSNSINWGKSYLDLAGGSFNGLFNQFTGGAFGASLRLLDKNYIGGLIRVRAWDGSVDQGQADVMPYKIGNEFWVDMNSLITNLDATATSRGLSETNTLADLVDAGGVNYHGFVTTIYEQLNENNFTQTTALRQGSLITAGVLNTLNGKPIIHRSSDNNGSYMSTYAPNGAGKSLYYVGDNNGNKSVLFGSFTGAGDYIYGAESGSVRTNVNNNVTLSNQKINNVALVYSTAGEVFILTAKQFLISTDIDFNFENNLLSLSYRFTNPNSFGMYSFQETVIWDNQLDRLDKETNINNAFSIY